MLTLARWPRVNIHACLAQVAGVAERQSGLAPLKQQCEVLRELRRHGLKRTEESELDRLIQLGNDLVQRLRGGLQIR